MNNMPLDKSETLDQMKNVYFEALQSCIEDDSADNLAKLREAEDAYMAFIETYG